MDIKDVLEQKLNSLGDQIEGKINEAVEAQKSNAKLELDNLKVNEIKGLTDNYNKLQEQVDSIESSTKRFAGSQSKKNWLSHAVDQIKSDSNFAEKASSREGFTIKNLAFKAETSMTGGADFVDSTTAANVVAPDRQSGIVFAPDRMIHVRQFLPQGTTTSEVIRYVQENGYSDGTAVKVEGTQVDPNTHFNLESKDAPVRTIGSYVRLSVEMLNDVQGLTAFLNTRLTSKLRLKEDNVLLYGNNAPALTGLTEAASAYVDVLADSNVNEFDVLSAAVQQARVAEYVPNAIMVNLAEYYAMLRMKGTDGHYILPESARYGGQRPNIDGVPIIASTAITAGDFLVGDFSAAQLFDRQQSTIKFYEADQDNAIKGLVTVTINERIALPIYNAGAFVYGTMAAAKANGSA